jgi:cytochrome P450
LNGEEWAKHRKAARKAFHNLDYMNERIASYTEEMLKKWQIQSTGIDVTQDVTRLTFSVILDFIGFDSTIIKHNEVDRIMLLVQEVLKLTWQSAQRPLTTTIWMMLPGTEFARNLKEYRTLLEDLVRIFFFFFFSFFSFFFPTLGIA